MTHLCADAVLAGGQHRASGESACWLGSVRGRRDSRRRSPCCLSVEQCTRFCACQRHLRNRCALTRALTFPDAGTRIRTADTARKFNTEVLKGTEPKWRVYTRIAPYRAMAALICACSRPTAYVCRCAACLSFSAHIVSAPVRRCVSASACSSPGSLVCRTTRLPKCRPRKKKCLS